MEFALVQRGDVSDSAVAPFAMRGLSCKKALVLLKDQKISLQYGRTITYPWNGRWTNAAEINVFASLSAFYPTFSTEAGQHSTLEHHDSPATGRWANFRKGNRTFSDLEPFYRNRTNHTGDIVHPDVEEGFLTATTAMLLLPLATPLAWIAINGVYVCKDWWHNGAGRRHNAQIDKVASHVRTMQEFAVSDKDALVSPALVPMLWPYLTAKEFAKLNFAQLQPMALSSPAAFQAAMLSGDLSWAQQNLWARLETLFEVALSGGNLSKAIDHTLSQHCISSEPLFLPALVDKLLIENVGQFHRDLWAMLLSKVHVFAAFGKKQQKKVLDLIEQGACTSLQQAFTAVRFQKLETDISFRLSDDVIVTANSGLLEKVSAPLAKIITEHQENTEIDWSFVSEDTFQAAIHYYETGQLDLEAESMKALLELAELAQKHQMKELHWSVQEKLAYYIPDLDTVQIKALLAVCSKYDMQLLNVCIDNHLAHASRWDVSRMQPLSLQFAISVAMAAQHDLWQYGQRLETHFSQQMLQLSQASDPTPPKGFEQVLVMLAERSPASIQNIWPALFPLLEVNQPLLGVIWKQAVAEKQMNLQNLIAEFCRHPDTHHIYLHPDNKQIPIEPEIDDIQVILM